MVGYRIAEEAIDLDCSRPVDRQAAGAVTGGHETDRSGEYLGPAGVRATRAYPTRRLKDDRRIEAGHECLGPRVEAAVVGQLHDVGGGQLPERIDRGPLDVATEQHGSPGHLDADDHGAVVELPVDFRPDRVQPRPAAPSEVAVFTGGNLDDPHGAISEPTEQEHHRAVRITPGLARKLRRDEHLADRERVGQLQRCGVVIEIRVADNQRIDRPHAQTPQRGHDHATGYGAIAARTRVKEDRARTAAHDKARSIADRQHVDA